MLRCFFGGIGVDIYKRSIGEVKAWKIRIDGCRGARRGEARQGEAEQSRADEVEQSGR